LEKLKLKAGRVQVRVPGTYDPHIGTYCWFVLVLVPYIIILQVYYWYEYLYPVTLRTVLLLVFIYSHDHVQNGHETKTATNNTGGIIKQTKIESFTETHLRLCCINLIG